MGLPQEFKERIRQQLGDAYEDFLAEYEKERVCGLRYNPLKIEKDRLRRALLSKGIQLETVPWAEEGFYYPPDAQPGKLPLHEAGAYYIQEPSAMMPAALLDPRPGERILDLCAAPGGKSTQIAGRLRGKGLLVSNEVIPSRAKVLSQNIERMGITNAVVLNEKPLRAAERFPVFFDRILVDAPCSGEGMFRKDADACGQWSPMQVENCAKRQREILSQAQGMLKPGGILVYSTCTFAPQENEETAEWFVQRYPQFTLERSVQIWPHLMRGEGHYTARFRKEGSFVPDVEMPGGRLRQKVFAESRRGRRGKEDAALDAWQLLQNFCREALSKDAAAWIDSRVRAGCLALFGSNLYLLPPEIGSLDGLKVQRAGLQIGSLKKNRFEPSHALAMALCPKDVKQVLEPDSPGRYLCGETINCSGFLGWTLLAVEGCPLGWGKASHGILKNHYPKGLRKNGL